MYSFSKMNVLIASAGVALLLASAPNANAAEMGGRGLRGVDAMSMDAVDADAAVTTKEMEINTNAFAAEAAEVGEGERALDCMGDGTFCDNLEGIGFDSCENCCSKPATFWPDRSSRHAARCLAGEQTRVAWEERPATAAAMVPVSCGIGLVTTVTKTVNVKQSKVEREG